MHTISPLYAQHHITLTLIMWELIFCLIHYVQSPENTPPTTYPTLTPHMYAP